MEQVTSEDDGEPAKEEDLVSHFAKLEVAERQLSVVIDGRQLICDESVLVRECKYFEAFVHFEKKKRIHIKGVLSYETFHGIVAFLAGDELAIDLGNFQELVQAAVFLQCPRAEDAAIHFISERLVLDNAFRVHNFGLNIGSEGLIGTTKFYIEKVFRPVLLLFSRAGSVSALLRAAAGQVEEVLAGDVPAPEDLLVYCLLAWLDGQEEERSVERERLLDLINWRLVSPPCLAGLAGEAMLGRRVEVAARHQALRPDRQVAYWREQPAWPERRWPKVIVAVGAGRSSVQWLDPARPAPVWRHLARQPADLRRRAAGSTMLYLHPKLYFLGGEQSWQLTWYDLESGRWGAAQGAPPATLLAGGAALGGELYLAGGVAVEDWAGAAGSAGQVVTSPLVARHLVEEGRWEAVPPLQLGRSSPGVAALAGWLYVVGGLRRREMLSSVCRYSPALGRWQDLPDLPELCSGSTVLARGTQLWVIGGQGTDYKVVGSSQVLDTESLEWRPGPALLQARKGAFGFLYGGRLFVCGGTGNGLRYLDSSEVLDDDQGQWEAARVPVKAWNCPVVAAAVRRPVSLLWGK